MRAPCAPRARGAHGAPRARRSQKGRWALCLLPDKGDKGNRTLAAKRYDAANTATCASSLGTAIRGGLVPYLVQVAGGGWGLPRGTRRRIAPS